MKTKKYVSPIDKFVRQHFKVDCLSDVKPLLNESQIKQIKKQFKNEKDLVKAKKTKEIPYTVIKADNGNLFAICRETFAQGGFSNQKKGLVVLRLCQNLDTGEFCLVKIAKGKKISKGESAFIERAKGFLGDISRQNSKGQEKYYIFMKIVPGATLRQALNDYTFDVVQQMTLCINILKKMSEMHQQGIIHRDLHANNILIDPKTLEVNIIDFGQSLQIDSSGFAQENFNGRLHQFLNGIDLIGISGTLKGVSRDPFLLQILNELIDKAGSPQNWNQVNLEPYINSLETYTQELSDKKNLRKMCSFMTENADMDKASKIVKKISNLDLAINGGEETVLMIAARENAVRVVKLFTKNNADVNKRCAKHYTALNYARGYGASKKIVKILTSVRPAKRKKIRNNR